MKPLTLAAATALFALLPGASRAQTPSVPAELRAAVDATFPGWQLATTRSSKQRQWIRGDFDGDGRADYAISIVRAADRSGVTADNRQALVAVMRRAGTAFRSFDILIVHEEPVSDLTYLMLARRGERVPDLDADANGDKTYVLMHDGIHIVYAEAAAITCRWLPQRTQPAFQCAISGD
jgi:hypothetical protein